MTKKSTKQVDDQVHATGEAKQENIFNAVVDVTTHRISYDLDFRDHCCEELQLIAGVLDMLVILRGHDHLDELGEEVAFVFMDARNRALALVEAI